MTEKFKTKLKENGLLRMAIFLVAAAVLFVYLNMVFGIGRTDASKEIFKDFYSEEEDSIDVVYMGTSATNRYYNGAFAYHEYGVAAYNVAVMGMPMFFTPILIDEVEKTQTPQLYIIELRNVLKSKNEVTDAHIRRVTDSMAFTSNKIDAVELAMDYTEGADGELSNVDEGILDYYIPIVKYHSKLTAGELKVSEVFLLNGQSAVRGYVLSGMTRTQVPQRKSVYSDDRKPLAPEMEAALNETLDACDAIRRDGREVMFVFSPYSVRAGEMEVFNTAMDMVQARGYSVLNCNDKAIVKEMGLDRKTDFYNSRHVNYLGAEKYTSYLTEYIMKNYDLPDHRGETGYESWEKDYERYSEYIEEGIKTEEE